MRENTEPIQAYIRALQDVFVKTPDKREANVRCRQLLMDMSGDAAFLTGILRKHLSTLGSLNYTHYPSVGIDIALNPYFGLVANCWIPLPDGDTQVSTKAIHHHGDMLLSTVTAFGPGYEHWMFARPEVIDPVKELFTTTLLERAPHPRHHVAFVDSYIAHVPLYPSSLTITYCLWSSQFPTTWRDYVKRVPLLQKNADFLRRMARKAGLQRQLELKVVDYFDFYPTCDGLRGMRDRREFERGPNEDYLPSLFHVIQQTGNEHLALCIRQKLQSGERIANAALVEKYVGDLERGQPIDGRLSPMHYGIPYANFTKTDIENALAVEVRQ